MELVWVMRDTPPVQVKDLVHSEFATRSPLEPTFEEDQRGKKLYYAVRWETNAAKKGDWSEIYSAIHKLHRSAFGGAHGNQRPPWRRPAGLWHGLVVYCFFCPCWSVVNTGILLHIPAGGFL
jgi:hypothetical protein